MNNSNNELLIDLNGLNTFKDKIEHKIPDISYSNGQLTKTINGTATPIASAAQIVSDGGGGSSISSLVIETTYANLVFLRNNSQLVPGQQYRITDYECTTIQDYTRSAGNLFDIIVTALDVNMLSEQASAVRHAGDTYFADCNIGAWQIWYCLDNDSVRFAWAQDNVGSITVQIDGKWYAWYYNPAAEGSPYPYGLKHGTTMWYSDRLDVEVGDTVYENYDGSGATATIEYRQGEGKGVIYRMIDEWNNDVCYDFKNIQFLGYKVDRTHFDYSSTSDYWVFPGVSAGWSEFGSDKTVVPDLTQSLYQYTFAASTGKDVTVSGFKNSYDNIIDTYKVYISNATPPDELPFVVLYDRCRDVTIRGDVCRIFLKSRVRSISIEGLCSDMFIHMLHESEIRDCSQLLILNAGNSNKTTFKECTNIWASNQLKESEFERCSNVHFTVSRYSYFREVLNLSLGNANDNNHIENCSNISFAKSYICYTKAENCSYVELTSTQTTGSGAKIQNLIIQGIKGTAETPKVISHDTLNNDFITTYQPANSQIISI